jgi:calcineurin-like phosphoesterase family protein
MPMRHESPVRDRNMSIWQSAKYDNVDDWTTARNRPRCGSEPKPPGAAAPPTDDGARPAEQAAASSAELEAEAKQYIRGLIARYGDLDWRGWLGCLIQYVRYSFEARFPQYNDWRKQKPPALSYGVVDYRLPSTCKVLLIGDWGTHMTDNVALLRQALKKLQPDAIIHLGDVYYSGTRQECRQNVLDVVDALVAELKTKRPPFFTLAGNHDYYSGGRGFYEMIGQINATLPGCEQKASYFCLRTADDHWQFLGMDTGYNDRNPINTSWPGLVHSEIAWHCDKLEHFSGTTILLSHHQLVSAKEVLHQGGRFPCLNAKLQNIFHPYFDRVAAWFWGHEHCLILFEDNLPCTGAPPLRKGRLIGCSAYEESVAQEPYGVTKGCEAAKFIKGMPQIKVSNYRSHLQKFYDHAFALLEVTPEKITAEYFSYPSWDQDFQMPAEPELKAPIYIEELPLIKAEAVTPPA